MGWGRPDPYYDPEKFGLSIVGEIDWSSGNYEFHLTVVWRRLSDGQLFYAVDSGCSCPSPFEGFDSVDDLTPCTFDELQAHLHEMQEDAYGGDRTGEIHELMLRVLHIEDAVKGFA